MTNESPPADDVDVPDGYTMEKTTSDTGAVYYTLCEDDGTEGET